MDGADARRGSRRSRWRALLLVAIGCLYVLSVPWYRETGDPLRIVWGLPDWVALALACYVLVAVLNSVAWLLVEMPDQASERETRE